MKKIFILLILLQSIAFANNDLSKIKQDMIKQSIKNYYGNCPCPYNKAKNGSSGGKEVHILGKEVHHLYAIKAIYRIKKL